ncbi:MAG: hypothetical protein HY721_29565 [Planctomycetes bacterium]|nr:hypothetical protein [Planctomycetota bacterium]
MPDTLAGCSTLDPLAVDLASPPVSNGGAHDALGPPPRHGRPVAPAPAVPPPPPAVRNLTTPADAPAAPRGGLRLRAFDVFAGLVLPVVCMFLDPVVFGGFFVSFR